MPQSQIKSKRRVQQHGEVFTALQEVNSMLDVVKDVPNNLASTYFEPACGTGNFLAEILKRKLKTAQRLSKNNRHIYESFSIHAISTIYGVDIQDDNVEESRQRLYDAFLILYVELFRCPPSDVCKNAIGYILERNIQCGNTLSATNGKGTPLIISEWTFDNDGCFDRKDFSFRDMVETGCSAEPIREYPRITLSCLPPALGV